MNPVAALRDRLRTVQLVPVTAFDARGQLALDPMQQLTARLLEAGVRVFIPCAGSAEFHSLTREEIVASVRMTRSVVEQQALVIAPVGQQLPDALRLADEAAEAGAEALLVMPLDFPYLSNEGARDYYQALLEKAPLPLLVYKKSEIPSDALLLDLADHPRLVGVKYAVNDLAAVQRMVERDEGRIEWYCGSAERYAPYFALAGCPGYTSGAGNVCPRITLALHAALAAGQWKEAFEWQRILLPIEHYRARAGNSYNISFLKYAVRRTGLDFGQPRPPQRRLTAAEQREIDELLEKILAAESELAAAGRLSLQR
jgi:4-hydroxy-tetrahydrodipicolinate synthase